MKLFTKDIDRLLFRQFNKGGNLDAQEVVAKIFNPYGHGRWYLLNSDPDDEDYIWAIVQMGNNVEVGSVSRSELESIRVTPFKFKLERDLGFRSVNAGELFRGLQQGKFYKKGGWVENENKEMAENQANEVKHHSEELSDALKNTDHVEAWVVGKMERATTDLSDVTHYLDGESKKMANGGVTGGIPNNYKGKRTDDIWNMLTENQRVHFLLDHADQIEKELGGSRTEFIDKFLLKSMKNEWKDLDEAVRNAFKTHTMMGQYDKGGEIKWQDVQRGDNARVKDENKMGVIMHTYGRKFNVKFVDGTEKTYDASELEFFKDDEYVDGGVTNGMEVVNYLKSVSGLRASYIAEWGDTNNVDLAQVEKAIKTKKLKPIDFSTALSGRDGNKYAKEIIKNYSQNKNYADGGYMEDGGSTKEYDFNPRTIFEFNPMEYLKEGISVVRGINWLYGREVGYNYEFTNKDNATLNVSRWYEDKAPNNYTAFLTIGGTKQYADSFASNLNKDFDSSSTSTTNGKTKFSYSIYHLSQKDIQSIIENFLGGGYMEKGGEIDSIGKAITDEYGIVKKDGISRGEIEDILMKNKNRVLKFDGKFAKYSNGTIPKFDKIISELKKDGWVIHDKYDDGGMMAKGGMSKKNVTFSDKVKSIQKSLLKRKKVSPKVQKDYGKTYNKKEALESAKRIAGAMRKKEK